VTPAALLESLLDLARDCGLEIRHAGGGEDPPPRSGLCRVHDRVWLVLVRSEPVEDRIEVVATALRAHAGSALESRYLPPAVRERLEKE
jgi:hypothetical protein